MNSRRRRAAAISSPPPFLSGSVSCKHNKPTTHQGDLTKLPRALAPLVERPQWAVWRWTQQPNGRWQKPPYQALDPQRHASTKDPDTWSDYATALATVQAGKADGIILRADRGGSVRCDRSGSLPRSGHALDRRLGAEFPRCGSSHLCRSDAVRRRLPDLGFDGRLIPIRSTENSRWRSTASRLPQSCSGAPRKR